MQPDFITEIANIALVLSFIVALVIGIAQVRTARRDRKDRLTLETLRNFQTKEFCELMFYVNSHKFVTTRKEMIQLSAEDQVKLMQFAQQMESLGLLVAERLIDMDLVDKTLGSFVVTSWEKYRPLFESMRITIPDPFLGEYFQWLAECIDKRMNECLRLPFHLDAAAGKKAFA